MPKYRATINGQPFEFEAANDRAAGEIIDREKERAGDQAPDQPDPVMAQHMARILDDPAAMERERGREAGQAMGQGAAAGLATQQGTLRQFGDELAGYSRASGLPTGTPPIISAPVGAARMLFGDEQAQKDYELGVEFMRGATEGAREKHPVTTFAGEAAGALAGPMGPAGIGGMVARGAAEGAAAGAGAGENAQERLTGAGVGAGVGGAVGAAIPILAQGAAGLWRGARGLTPEAAVAAQGAREGERIVGERLAADLAREGQGDPAVRAFRNEFAERSGQAQQQGIVDQGGENLRATADWAARHSPEARQELAEFAQERYQSQGPRAAEWLERSGPGVANEDRLTQLRAQARAENAPRYNRAYAEGEAGIWNPRLQELTSSAAVQQAIRGATARGRDYAALEGTPVPRNPFQEDPATGVLMLPEGQRPTLRFWDHVQRGLREEAESAQSPEAAARIRQIRDAVLEELDRAAPSFGAARRGAAAFFGAEDALEAGQRFLQVSANQRASDIRQAVAAMSPAERRLFREGVEQGVLQRVRGLARNRDINNLDIFTKPELQDRLALALGPQRLGELQNYMIIERGMDSLRNALGNSATARRLIEDTAITGGTGAALYGGGDPRSNFTVGGVATALAGLLAKGNSRLNRAAANRIAQLLTSQDPEDIQTVVRAMQRNPAVRDAVKRGMARLDRVLAQQAGAAYSREQ